MNTPPGRTDSPWADGLAEAAGLLRGGDAPGARTRLLHLLEMHPKAAAVHKALAILHTQTNQPGPAIEHMRAASAAEPGSGPLQCELGCLLAHFGRHGEALEHFDLARRLQPESADGWYFHGITLARLNRYPEARASLRRALELPPRQTRAVKALARIELIAGFPDDALPLWRELAHQQPDDLDVVLRLGETLGRVGRHEEARRLFADALARSPESAELCMALAQAEEDLGDRDAAEAAYEQALERRPGWIFPLAGLLGLRRGQAPEARVQQALALQASATLADADRSLLGYELGKVHDGHGDYRRAMASWDDANLARQRMIGRFDLAELFGRAERCMQVFDAALFARARAGDVGSDDDRPVFVVGMPRSGTTLTEQILGSHGQMAGCGELPDIALIAQSLPSRRGTPQRWPHILEDIALDPIRQASARYLEAAARHAPAGAMRLVDKAPMNYYLLGLVALMFPRARVVWCRRDPRDVAVSIYGENFSLDERFATSFEGIGHIINLQNRMMRHWQAVLPTPILELDYQQLVSDVEGQSRRLVDFVGLPWDPTCLEFHVSGRGVQTPSRWQVRQPVHTRSIGRWRNYEFALPPLLAVLDPDSLPGP